MARRSIVRAVVARLRPGQAVRGGDRLGDRDETGAEAAWRAGDWDEAAAAWGTVLEGWAGKAPPRVYARLSGSQARAGLLDDAEVTLRAGLERHAGNERLEREYADLASQRGNWQDAAQRWRRVIEREGPARATSVVRLSVALRRIGETAEAEAVVRDALRRSPDDLRLLHEYAQTAAARGDTDESVRRWQRVVSAEGDQRSAVTLARYSRALRAAGAEDEAMVVVRDGLSRDPAHPELLVELGEAAMACHDWDVAVDAWRALLASNSEASAGVRWHHRLGIALERSGRPREAAQAYATAVDGLDSVTQPWANEAAVAWRFRRDYVRRLAGMECADDPRLACAVAPEGPPPPGTSPGRYDATVTHKGVRIHGSAGASVDRVEVRVDGRPIRTVTVDRVGPARSFALHLKHPTLATLPPSSQLTVVTPEGTALASGASTTALRVSLPHGDGSLWERLAAGAVITKKGTLFDPVAFAESGAREQVELYTEVRRVIAQELDEPLMLLYGSLLGFHRDGAFIPGDDDLDVGYLTDATDARTLKAAAVAATQLLLRAGFDVTTRFGGGLMKVTAGAVELDIYPLWRHAGSYWGYDAIDVGPEAFVPSSVGTFHGVEVDVPRDPDAILAASYGPAWRTPDPAFSHDRPPEVMAVLESAYLTPQEGREIVEANRRDRAADPSIGVFVVARDAYGEPGAIRSP